MSKGWLIIIAGTVLLAFCYAAYRAKLALDEAIDRAFDDDIRM